MLKIDVTASFNQLLRDESLAWPPWTDTEFFLGGAKPV